MGKAPKRRNIAATKARILDAAKQAFTFGGYSQTGIRDIAEIADVSSTLLLKHFGSKAGLFEAALREAMSLDEVLSQDKAQFGRHLADLLTREGFDVTPPVLVAVTSAEPEARDIAARVTQERLVAPLADWLGAPDGAARALEIAMLATGFVIYARQLPLALSARRKNALKAWLAEAVQRVVDRDA